MLAFNNGLNEEQLHSEEDGDKQRDGLKWNISKQKQRENSSEER